MGRGAGSSQTAQWIGKTDGMVSFVFFSSLLFFFFFFFCFVFFVFILFYFYSSVSTLFSVFEIKVTFI